jgi:hypothetical protein
MERSARRKTIERQREANILAGHVKFQSRSEEERCHPEGRDGWQGMGACLSYPAALDTVVEARSTS